MLPLKRTATGESARLHSFCTHAQLHSFSMLFSRLSLCRGQRKGSPPLFWGRVALFTGARFPSSRKNSVALPTLNPFQVTLLGTRRRKTTGSVQAGASCSWRVCVDGREPATIYRRQPDLSVLQKCITLLATPAPNMCSTWRSYGLVMSLPWRRDAKAQGSALLRGLGTSTPGRYIE